MLLMFFGIGILILIVGMVIYIAASINERKQLKFALNDSIVKLKEFLQKHNKELLVWDVKIEKLQTIKGIIVQQNAVDPSILGNQVLQSQNQQTNQTNQGEQFQQIPLSKEANAPDY